MLRKIEHLIPAALEAINTILVPEYKNGIPSAYQSAASGFGATLLQMGLLPTLAVYADEGSDADINRQMFMKVLVKIIKHKHSRFGEEDKNKLGVSENYLTDALQDKFPIEKFKDHLLQASLAFKLAIRTYKLKGK